MMGRIALIANAAIVVLLLVVGSALYLGEKASAAELRRTNDSILAQSQNETQQAIAAGSDSQSLSDSILAQSQNETQQSQARNSELTHERDVAVTRVQLILDVTQIGLQAEQGSDTTQAMSTWYGRMAALNDPTIQNLHDPRLERRSNGEYVMFLASSVLDVLH